MNARRRRCDQCGRTIRRPGLIVYENIFCSARCKQRFPSQLRRRLTDHYRQMADDAGRWIDQTLAWNESHPDEEPIDIEPLRLVKRGALEIVAALRGWAPIPQQALRLINSATLGATHDLGEEDEAG
ncbi:MAG TPA: hypothetical protein VG826_04775 [Pirellulales bacterium]|nr:hypothetical protein [Pirellulales bacterium]